MIRKKKGKNKTRFPMFSYIFLIKRKNSAIFTAEFQNVGPKGFSRMGKKKIRRQTDVTA